MTAVCQAIIGAVRAPRSEIVCVDCGGVGHLISHAREDGVWLVGDIATYRCSDCRDRWDIILIEEDLQPPTD